MITIRRSEERGHADHGWLDTHHTFSFAGYYDPAHMGFGPLRVINEDRVAPRGGFGPHPHRDMEILSYVLEGNLGHIDSTGQRAVIRPGVVQRMSAGTGIVHAEENPSRRKPVHFLQIWIEPDRAGHAPRYEDRAFELPPGRLTLIASADGREGSFDIHQDADVYVSRFANGEGHRLPLEPGLGAWVQVTRGAVSVNGVPLSAGDGAAVTEEGVLALGGDEGAEALVFVVAP